VLAPATFPQAVSAAILKANSDMVAARRIGSFFLVLGRAVN
jgi:hypothetical protein